MQMTFHSAKLCKMFSLANLTSTASGTQVFMPDDYTIVQSISCVWLRQETLYSSNILKMMMTRLIPIPSPIHIIIFIPPLSVPVPEVDFPSSVVLLDIVEPVELPTVPMMVVVTRKPALLLIVTKMLCFFLTWADSWASCIYHWTTNVYTPTCIITGSKNFWRAASSWNSPCPIWI